MKMPIATRKPTPPVKPAKTYLARRRNPKLDGLFDFGTSNEITIKQIIDVFPADIDLNKVIIWAAERDYCPECGGGYDLDICEQVEIDDPNYEKNQESYLKDLEKHKSKVQQYEIWYEKFLLDSKKYQEEYKEKRIAKLEKELIKLKK